MSGTLDHARLIDELVSLVERAGEEIMRIYRSPFAVETKADDSPLTQADLASHRTLLAGLSSLAPALPVVSEESSPPPFAERRAWPRYWLVDPLDGTKEFVSRNGEFTVNVALIERGRPLLGVVGVPALGQVFVGSVPERCAERRARGSTTRLRCRPLDRSAPIVVVASRSHGGERLERYLDRLAANVAGIERTSMGSSLKFCVLAEGRADLYPRLGPTSEWDVAAAHAVLEAAGGAVWTLDRKVLVYNSKESFLNPDFVAVADPDAPWRTLLPDVASLGR
jgi:3'(2'), 5'-bisphosphate nucleotidase